MPFDTRELPVMVDSTEPPGDRGRAPMAGRQADPQLGQPRRRRRRRDAARPVPALAREYGAAVVCTCIDTEGQARTAEWKLRAAQAIHDLAVGATDSSPPTCSSTHWPSPVDGHGGEPAGRDRDLEGIRRIKSELPGVSTILGLSNVSFGLNPAARQVLNSVFLHECVEAGLDAAIVHAARIVPLSRSTSRPGKSASTSSTTAARADYDPLAGAARAFEGGGRDQRPTPKTAATGPSSGASSSASWTATATASRPTSTRRSAAGGRRWTSSTTCCWRG